MSQPESHHTSRLYNGNRRIDVTLPASLVAALDLNIADFPYFLTRSSVVEVAIKQFLDRGGVYGSIPIDPAPGG